jgi:hypothetical protein
MPRWAEMSLQTLSLLSIFITAETRSHLIPRVTSAATVSVHANAERNILLNLYENPAHK